MGTRNLTCVVADGEFKIAQYGQWDGYPSGQGRTVLAFLTKHFAQNLLSAHDKEIFINKCNALTKFTDAEVETLWAEAGMSHPSGANHEISKSFFAKNPGLTRDVAAEILEMVYTGEVTAIQDASEFAADGLFCEWAYVIDLDNDCLEVHKGFCNEVRNPAGRFAGMTPSNAGYLPVQLVKTFPFADLPEEELFIVECDPPEEDEDE